MLLQPDPWSVADRVQRRRDEAARYRVRRSLRAEAARRRAERAAVLRRDVGFRLMELGLRLVAAPPRGRGALSSSRRRA